MKYFFFILKNTVSKEVTQTQCHQLWHGDTDSLSRGLGVLLQLFLLSKKKQNTGKNQQKKALRWGAWFFFFLLGFLNVHLNNNLIRNNQWATYLLGLQLGSRREGNTTSLTSCLPETDAVLTSVQSWQWIHVLNCFLFAGKEVGFMRVDTYHQGKEVSLHWCQWLCERHYCLQGFSLIHWIAENFENRGKRYPHSGSNIMRERGNAYFQSHPTPLNQ